MNFDFKKYFFKGCLMGALIDFNIHFLPSFISWHQFEQFQALSFPLSPFYEFIQILPIHLLLQPPYTWAWDLQSIPTDWFVYYRELHHKRVYNILSNVHIIVTNQMKQFHFRHFISHLIYHAASR